MRNFGGNRNFLKFHYYFPCISFAAYPSKTRPTQPTQPSIWGMLNFWTAIKKNREVCYICPIRLLLSFRTVHLYANSNGKKNTKIFGFHFFMTFFTCFVVIFHWKLMKINENWWFSNFFREKSQQNMSKKSWKNENRNFLYFFAIGIYIKMHCTET